MAKAAEPAKAAVPAKAAGGGFVANLVTDPANVPDLAFLFGYPGASSIKGHTRLYLSPDLREYYEIPDSVIRYREDAPNHEGPAGGVYMWIDSEVELTRKARNHADVKAKFFSGDIQQEFLGGDADRTEPLVGPTGVQHCTQAPQYCGNTAWQGCRIGPTGIQYCTQAPHFCGDTKWSHCTANNCPPGISGILHCTQAPPLCGGTNWPACTAKGCETEPPGPIGQTGVHYCTSAPPLCGNTHWQGCTAPGCCATGSGTGDGQGNVGPTGVRYCTQAPQYCGNTQWQGCTATGCQIGPTGVQYCTQAPQYCGNTAWKGCPR